MAALYQRCGRTGAQAGHFRPGDTFVLSMPRGTKRWERKAVVGPRAPSSTFTTGDVSGRSTREQRTCQWARNCRLLTGSRWGRDWCHDRDRGQRPQHLSHRGRDRMTTRCRRSGGTQAKPAAAQTTLHRRVV